MTEREAFYTVDRIKGDIAVLVGDDGAALRSANGSSGCAKPTPGRLRSADPGRKPGESKPPVRSVASGSASPSPRRSRCTPPARWAAAPDRKSTRLNSSHLVISYAVFCLKKKK